MKVVDNLLCFLRKLQSLKSENQGVIYDQKHWEVVILSSNVHFSFVTLFVSSNMLTSFGLRSRNYSSNFTIYFRSSTWLSLFSFPHLSLSFFSCISIEFLSFSSPTRMIQKNIKAEPLQSKFERFVAKYILIKVVQNRPISLSLEWPSFLCVGSPEKCIGLRKWLLLLFVWLCLIHYIFFLWISRLENLI